MEPTCNEPRDIGLPDKACLYSLVVKVTSGCNLACAYCYLASHNAGMGNRRIDGPVIRAAIESYARVAAICRGTGRTKDGAAFLWHGGEPTVAGRAFLRDCFDYQRKYFIDPSRVRNCLTTNGVLIDGEWIALLREYAIEVSVSIDGPADIHDAYRPKRNGDGSFRDALNGYLRLRDAGLDPGIMMVVTEEASAKADAVHDFFGSLGVMNIAFVPYVTRSKHIAPESYYRFLERFFDRWWEQDRPDFYVRDFDTIVARLYGGHSTLCEYNNCCGNYLALDVDGSVYSCDLFIGDQRYRVGHLPNDEFLEILDGGALARHIEAARALPDACRECAYSSLCGGGCLFRRKLAGDEIDIYCTARVRIADHIARAINAATVPNGVCIHGDN